MKMLPCSLLVFECGYLQGHDRDLLFIDYLQLQITDHLASQHIYACPQLMSHVLIQAITPPTPFPKFDEICTIHVCRNSLF